MVHRLDYGFEQASKPSRDLLHFFVERLFREIVVHVSHKVNQTLLLRALDCIISGIEVRDEDSAKFAKDLLKRAAFSRLRVNECHVL
jgi:hypothetical protein